MKIEGMEDKHLQRVHEGQHNRIVRSDNWNGGKPVLIKLDKSTSPLSRQAALFANELKITKEVDHPGIRKALSVGSISGKPALYLEYIDGVCLKAYCAAEKPDLAEMVSIGQRIAEILAALHGANIIYKNLCSEHVMMGPGEQPVLIDFTIAVKCTSSHMADRPDRLEGKLSYISPEQTGRINRIVDYRTDLYSLGVVLYEMLSGRLPFTTTTTAELIHDHIARQPRTVCSLNPEVPEGLSAIIMKLLSKSTEERYQSALGVAKDLERCQLQLQENGRVQPFTLGTDDLSSRLLVPQRLYGRAQELEQLAQAFNQAAEGNGAVVLVSGPAGSGKTLLVNELKRRVVKNGGMFVTGSYDQYQRNVPYNGINQALFALTGILSGLGPQRLRALRFGLQQITQSWGEGLKAVLPGLQMLLTGFVQEEAQVPLQSIDQSINAAICGVLHQLAREWGPLVLFLDSLQWADSASLEVLRQLSEEQNDSFLLTIGACDESWFGSDKALHRFSVGQLARDTGVQWIRLENLHRDSIQHLVEDMVRSSGAETAALAGIVFDKTGGNPLLAVEFIQSLYDEGALRFDFNARRWRWDEAVIREKAIVDDVIATVTMKVKSLSESAQEVLMMAACIGNVFDLETLAVVMNQAPDAVRDHLKGVEAAYLVVSNGDVNEGEHDNDDRTPFLGPTRFAFSHARVRQAAYLLLPTQKRRLTHLHLGRLYLSRLSDTDLKKHIFMVVNQLNEGFRHIEAPAEQLRLAELNRIAGNRARHTGAYTTAIWYFNMGLGLLPQDRWVRCNELSHKLFEETIEAEYLSCNFSRVHLLAEELAEHAESGKGRAKAVKFQILAHAAQGNRDQAFAAALKALEALDILKRAELPALSPLTEASPGQLDTATIIKASHMLSREIHLERLLEKFMQIVMESAGAEKGVLIVEQDDRMMIQARGKIGVARIEILETLPLTESDDVPQSVIRTVVNSKSAVVLGEAHRHPQFSQDPYLRMHRARSVLGLPIIHQAKLIGVLYLENNLATNIFDKDQLPLLNALLSQAAISMENAKLYADLEEKLAELNLTKDALADSRNWLDKIINAIGDPVFVKDRQHRWALLNDALCEFMGIAREELLGKSDYDFFPKKEADVFWAVDERVFTTGRESINEEKISDPQGQPHTIITRKTLYTDEKGNQYIVGLIRDITDRVNLEAQLRQAMKMESVGRLAGGVAHDFNNMLGVILGYGELALDQTDPGQELHGALQEIINAAHRSADITRQLLAFARKQTISPKLLDINKTVAGMTRMLQRLIGEDIDLKWLPGDVAWPLMMDPGQFDQIMANLCINARDAIADVGKVIIETGVAEFDEIYCTRHLGYSPGEYVMLIVSDNGCGMDAETMDNIFDPFFTTKESGKGTGLGLATVYGIVKQNKGFISVYSEPGQGTTFKIYLPRYRTKADLLFEKEKAPPAERGHETILLVEDESSILKMTTRMLKKLGYTVLVARTPGEAMEHAREHEGEIHLLLTDVIMPEMNGRDLAKTILSIYPNLKRLFMSGYTANVIAHHGVLDEGVNFIQKPFSQIQLGTKVREVLDMDED